MLKDKIKIIPKPVSMILGEGSFNINDQTVIESDPKLNEVAKYFVDLILPATSFSLGITSLKTDLTKSNTIYLILNEKLSDLTEEGYTLKINQERIVLSAPKPVGIFYGIQTIRQLLPIEIEKINESNGIEWRIPSVDIKDYPRFSWRGYMLDEGRHFLGKDVVKHILDLMALFKMNVFHWHLTEDQGWRIEIKKYPLLIEVGSKREKTQIGGFLSKKMDTTPHEGYYTQEEIREIISYADKLFIKIIPEIDMPGHSKAALAAYPKFSCTEGPFEVSTTFGIKKDVYCIGKEETFEFLQNILDEIIRLFPSEIIHIGGDEVPKKRWEKCPDCQDRIKSENLKNEKELQTYFTERIKKFLSVHNHRLMGWNQILDDKSSKDIIGQYWIFGKKVIINHLRKGGNIVFSKFGSAYLDYSYKFTSLGKAYRYEPIPKKLQKEHHNNVLGIEATMWTEWVRNIRELDWQTFPRLIAFAETGWTPIEQKNFKSFKFRLENLLNRLNLLGVNYAKKEEYQSNFLGRALGFSTLLREPKRRSLYK
ncbi:MAG TPA: beta-N-acetylhexosaminidase [Candidatus Nanopelagicaceae bacterium]|nr:beta-N-acetylhexosaminidase [Candidatus Nanopelagicaceae bacterium]